jgi:predicted GNAT superfamily acetyltransferase
VDERSGGGDRASDGAVRPVDPAVVAEARATTERAATHADVELATPSDPTTMHEVAALFDHVWGRDADAGTIMAPEALTALAHAGGQVSTARRRGELVGATAAFIGWSRERTPFLHSHVTGVVASQERRGVGRALKWHQRSWALDRGIGVVRWTFDPLIRRNAVFNLVVLGAQVVAFAEDVYGPMHDARNAGTPTDRLLIEWRLDAPRVRAAASGRAAEPDVDALQRAGAAVVLSVDDDGAPRQQRSEAPRRLVQVPADIETMRQRDPDLARGWADALRDTLGAAVAAGARVSGATRTGWYVLSAEHRTDELAGPR